MNKIQRVSIFRNIFLNKTKQIFFCSSANNNNGFKKSSNSENQNINDNQQQIDENKEKNNHFENIRTSIQYQSVSEQKSIKNNHRNNNFKRRFKRDYLQKDEQEQQQISQIALINQSLSIIQQKNSNNSITDNEENSNIIPKIASQLQKLKDSDIKNLKQNQRNEMEQKLIQLLLKNLDYEALKEYQNYYPNIVSTIQNRFELFSQDKYKDYKVLQKVLENMGKLKNLDHISVVQVLILLGKLSNESYQILKGKHLNAKEKEKNKEILKNLKEFLVGKLETDMRNEGLKQYLVKELVTVLWALDKIGELDQIITDRFFQEIIKKQREISLKDLAMMQGVLINQGNLDKIEILQEFYMENISSIKLQKTWPRDISTILWGFSKLGNKFDIQVAGKLLEKVKTSISLFTNPQDIAQAMASLVKIKKIIRYKKESIEKAYFNRLNEQIGRIQNMLCDLFFKDVIIQINNQQNSKSEEYLLNKSFWYKYQDIAMFLNSFVQSELKDNVDRLQQLGRFLKLNRHIIKNEYLGQIFLLLKENDKYIDLINQESPGLFYFVQLEDILSKDLVVRNNIGDILLALYQINRSLHEKGSEEYFSDFQLLKILDRFLENKKKKVPVQQFCNSLQYLDRCRQEEFAPLVEEFLLHQNDNYFRGNPNYLAIAQLGVKNLFKMKKMKVDGYILLKFLKFTEVVMQSLDRRSDKRGAGNAMLNNIRFLVGKKVPQQMVDTFLEFFRVVEQYGVKEFQLSETINSIKAIGLLKYRNIEEENLNQKCDQALQLFNRELLKKIQSTQKYEGQKQIQAQQQQLDEIFQAELKRGQGNLLENTYQFLKSNGVQINEVEQQ